MSIQDSDGTSYSAHDVHHIAHDVLVDAGTGGDDVTQVSAEEFEITERGLDPDELAELRAMRVQIGAIAQAGQPQDSRGTFQFSVDAGYNIGEDDALTLTGANVTDFDPDGDGTDEIQAATRDTDEVGQVYTFSDTYTIGFDDDTNGNGAGTNTNASTETLNMAELFGSGPFVDSADDFASVITAKPDNVVEDFGVRASYSLYYDVSQTEGGRSRFGR